MRGKKGSVPQSQQHAITRGDHHVADGRCEIVGEDGQDSRRWLPFNHKRQAAGLCPRVVV